MFRSVALLIATALTGTVGELVLLQHVTRHGIRSPKAAEVTEYCPKDPWRYKWDESGAQLTGPGELEEQALGKVLHQAYGGFLGSYNGSRHFVRATDADRVLQSAEVVMASLFPPGTGPASGLPGRPTFVPIHTVPESEDTVLSGGPMQCWPRMDREYTASEP